MTDETTAAIKQAHERIIGERVVPNDEKTFSFYQPHTQIYVRGKSGADVEFGLQILLSESADEVQSLISALK